MPITVKQISLWRKETENRPGLLAETLQPLSEAGADLQVLMGYRHGENRAAIELYPVSGKKATAAAAAGGLEKSSIPTLLVEGDNRPGTAQRMAAAIAGAGVDLHFFIAQAVGKRYTAVLGFDSEANARKAAALIKKAGSGRR